MELNFEPEIDLDKLEFKLEPEDQVLLDKLTEDTMKCAHATEVMFSNQVSNNIREQIAYTCGLLGKSKEETKELLKTEDFNLNTENIVSDIINTIISKIKEAWDKIVYFFKKVWVKIQAYYYDITKNIFGVRKIIYSMKNKNNILVNGSDYKEFLRDFSAYLTNIEIMDKTSIEISNFIGGSCYDYVMDKKLEDKVDLLSKLIEFSNNKETYINNVNELFIKYGSIKEFTFQYLNKKYKDFFISSVTLGEFPSLDIIINNDGLLEATNVTGNYINAITSFISKIDNSKQYEISHLCLLRLSEAVDECKGFIKNGQRELFSVEGKIKTVIKKVNIKNTDEIDRLVLKNLMLVSSSMVMPYIQSIIRHIRLGSKWVKKFYKYYEIGSELYLDNIYKEIKNSKPGEFKFYPFVNQNTGTIDSINLQDPDKVKLVKKDDYGYFILSRRDFDAIKTRSRAAGGFCIIRPRPKAGPFFDGQVTKADDILEKENITGEEPNVILYNRGIIVLDKEELETNKALKMLFGISNNLDFVYYHELGHLVTGQHETFISNQNNSPEELYNYFRFYAYNKNENKADAYACLKTGISPDKVAEKRFEYFKETGEYEIFKSDDFNRIKLEMIKNITLEMHNMRSISKLSFLQYIRSYRSNNKGK